MLMLLCVITGAKAEDYKLWINDVQVTDANAGDLTGIDGVVAGKDGAVLYMPEQKWLLLDNASITNVGEQETAIRVVL